MSRSSPPKPAKLVIGFFLKEKNLGIPVVENLIERFGEVDIVSEWMSFDQTTYYEPEMGAPLYRRMMAFETLIQQNQLAEVKLFANEIEKRASHSTPTSTRRGRTLTWRSSTSSTPPSPI